MTIIRIRKRKPGFTVIDNQPIEDISLRWDTLGLFTYLMSKPDGWEINVTHLWKQKRGAGRDKIYRMLRELEAAGYFKQERVRRSDGTFDWVKTLFETPQPLPENQEMEVQGQKSVESPLPENQEMEVRGQKSAESPLPGLPYTDEPYTANQDALVNTDLVSTELVNTDPTSPHISIHQQQNNNDKLVIQDHARTRAREEMTVVGGGGDGDDFSIWDAFRLAGIRSRTARRIPEAWKQATGNDLTPEDVLAWHYSREAYNTGLPPAQQMRVGAIITALEDGDPADEKFYDRAREYLTELTAGNEDDEEAPEPLDPEIPGLHRALEAYLPPIAEIGIEALDDMRAGLLGIAHNLLARGVTAEDLADLRLYLIYTEQPIPQPENVADALVQAGPEFQAWRERKAEAERLWKRIVQHGDLATPGSAVDQVMRRATPVDLNGSLVIIADSGLEHYFTRLWPRKAAEVLSDTEYPEDLPVQFITHQVK